jgi:small subunit ribosomal protein S1
LKVLKHDTATQRISLGLKQLQPHPWDGIETKYPVGSLIKGKVKSTAPFGVFVEVAPGIEGLIHVSELSWTERVKDPKKAVKSGQEIEVKVLSIDREKEKLSLSLKRAGENPWEKAKKEYRHGSQIEGQITHITNFGAFVKISSGLEALIRNQDLSWTDHSANASKLFKAGDTVKAVVLDVNVAEEKMSLGIKQLSQDPFSSLKVGQTVNGTVSKVMDFGLFVKLDGGFEGFVRSNEIEASTRSKFDDERPMRGERPTPTTAYKEGDAVTASILKINKKDRKIDLSIRRFEKNEERELLKKYSGKNDRMTIGDVTGWND